ncbi:hypothetical protein [Rhodocytophaga aerolata]|uniref:hypothetical protein n=1 Tax=Rhodocytophaga aerolata TaxID=455078 RepID=UPI00367227B9
MFRRALLDKEATIHVLPVSNYIDEADMIHGAVYNKKIFFENASTTQIDPLR